MGGEVPELRPQTSGERRSRSAANWISVLSPQPPTSSAGPACQYRYTSARERSSFGFGGFLSADIPPFALMSSAGSQHTPRKK